MIALFGLFLYLAYPVARRALLTLATPPTATGAAQLDAAVSAMRHDAWGAVSMVAPSPHELVLTDGAGHAVRWQFGDALLRDGHPYPAHLPGATVAVGDGGVATLTVPEGRSVRGGTVVLQSEAALIGKATR